MSHTNEGQDQRSVLLLKCFKGHPLTITVNNKEYEIPFFAEEIEIEIKEGKFIVTGREPIFSGKKVSI